MESMHESLARELARAWREGETVALPTAARGARSRAEAYAIQDRMAELIGQPTAGWKVGATVRAVQLFEGHDGPLPGRVFADRVFDGEARLPARLFPGAKVECEFAFRLCSPLPRGAGDVTPEALAPLVDFHPAIELASIRYAPGTGERAVTTFDAIADNGGAGAAVLGAAVKNWQQLDLTTMAIEARIDGSPPIQAYSGPYRRPPIEIAAEAFTDIRRRGHAVEVGAFVLTGSATLPTPLRAGQTLIARFAELPAMTLSLE
jgi:2-keto-4-pentenoate hydratase